MSHKGDGMEFENIADELLYRLNQAYNHYYEREYAPDDETENEVGFKKALFEIVEEATSYLVGKYDDYPDKDFWKLERS